MLMKNPNLSYRAIGFSRPLSFRFGVVTLDMCPNTDVALDKPAGLASASLSATCIHTITSSIGGCSHNFGISRACISTAT
jgi:hypothetical protein